MSENYKIYEKDRAYFVIMTVVGWIDLFSQPNHKLLLIESLKQYQKHKGLEIYGYCIMIIHIYLIARAEGSFTL